MHPSRDMSSHSIKGVCLHLQLVCTFGKLPWVSLQDVERDRVNLLHANVAAFNEAGNSLVSTEFQLHSGQSVFHAEGNGQVV